MQSSGRLEPENEPRPRFFAPVSDFEAERSPAGFKKFKFDGEEEAAKRVVRSTKEKRYEELTNLIKQIRNHKKIKDMSSMLSSFEELTRAYQKALPVVTKEENGVTPRFYVRILAELDAFINEVWEDKEGRLQALRDLRVSLFSSLSQVKIILRRRQEQSARAPQGRSTRARSPSTPARSSRTRSTGRDLDAVAASIGRPLS
ncbi:eukaryotic translation initiation factor 3 subunit C-like isoform X2 [Neocloeon triangulifer]|uniref:eukaryotic translation initiation factor 3 subunit C-like isoform X2 n=1 Tax=Neocloeon triangulifer TaxID=2078957 RepID=UPI00286EF737|nr:eukaryotic translation initiation factor 3 subunit C-like isoform X2 [Neocloeon triangulifer]XP_059474566.1 eukaryotic translation initiation factor 3 subunit C-like isoform X2 [Neocloeon triangulifer]XP_059474574.1 eukaryotic translation initiation factor 3 subunit C-like isoform X2 [Neocloeon triangulifer]